MVPPPHVFEHRDHLAHIPQRGGSTNDVKVVVVTVVQGFVLHLSDCLFGPEHGGPPVYVLQIRILVRIPEPQDALQDDHLDQGLYSGMKIDVVVVVVDVVVQGARLQAFFCSAWP